MNSTDSGTTDLVAEGRERLDALDAGIIALVKERVTVSEQVQAARIAAGERRVNLTREMEILRRYRDELGRQGTQLAMTLLELSRGRA
ncbi:chorismate mutase [Streptomyces specialis]|uniref:chorismate mutase n=1 Tax=Streptomyces specialis TaxID=498367 RepID=UPI00073F40A7|nr:chorismate mutase [Streptomyces specialis]